MAEKPKTRVPGTTPVELHRLTFLELFNLNNSIYESLNQDEEANREIDQPLEEEPTPADEMQNVNKNSSFPDPSSVPLFLQSAKDPVQCYDYQDGTKILISTPPYEKNPDWKLLRNHLAKEGRLELDVALELVRRTRVLMRRESNVVYLRPPYTLVGDVHGQYFDLLSMFQRCGEPDSTNYLFLGDYVDRGVFGIEVVLLLCALKLNFPNTFHLIRGNHECRALTSHFTFEAEVKKKYKCQDLYWECMLLFDALPLAVLLEDETSRFLCIHGGLSPEIECLADIEAIDRMTEPEEKGALCDLLWSDPLEEDTAAGLSDSEMQEWYDVRYVDNPTRGCGQIFGYAATRDFLELNRLDAIIRAHEVQRVGYGLNRFKQKDGDPLVITLFSAPNYCDFYANKAAVLRISPPDYNHPDDGAPPHTRMEFIQFDCVPHPFWLPKFQDGIEYSFPFLMNKVSIILHALLGEDTEDPETDEEKKFYRDVETMMKEYEDEKKTKQTHGRPGLRKNPSVALLPTSAASTRSSITSIASSQSSPRSEIVPSPRKEFLSVRDRIDALNADVISRSNVVKRLSESRSKLIDQKIFQNKMQAYISKATTKFQKAKQIDWMNECLPES